MNERSQGTRRRVVAFVALVAAAVLGGTTAQPVRAAPSVADGAKLQAPRRDKRPPAPPTAKVKTTPSVGEVSFRVPRRSQAITAFRVWLDADISAFSEVQIEVTNVSEANSKVFEFAIVNEADANVGNDHVSIILDANGSEHHLLSFRLNSDYIPTQGCTTSWNGDLQQEVWSVRVSGKPDSGAERLGIPLQKVGVRSYDFGNPCPSNVMQYIQHCIDPHESVVVRPSFGRVLACATTRLSTENTQ